MARINRTLFFSTVRANPFGGRLTQQNVDGCNAIIDLWETEPLAQASGDLNALGYILATAFGETGNMKWDVKEGSPKGESRNAYFTRMYDIRGPRAHVAEMLGNTQPGDGAKYFGRSWPQITGRSNYTKFAKRLGVDLIGNPDLALRKDIAARILVDGMFLGLFTGRKLGQYFDGKSYDDAEMKRRRIRARGIINGTDKAEQFARVAAAFTMALRTATVGRAALFDAADILDPMGQIVAATRGTPPRNPAWVEHLREGNPSQAAALPTVPAILGDMAPAVISAAVREATGGKVDLPVDRGKPLFKSLTVNGALLAGVPGIVGAITAIQDRVVAVLVVGLIVAGVALVVTGRVQIKQEAGV